MKKITKAVIPAAGLGTRMLPYAHAVPKEMLPIVDLPAIYYLVEEAVQSGIRDILVITNRGKESIENFFDYSVEYDSHLRRTGRSGEADRLRTIADMANITFLRQHEARGLGHAVLRAQSFIGEDPFVVLYGDDIIFSKTPVSAQLIRAYEAYGRPVAAVKPVPPELLRKYCSLRVSPIAGNAGAYLCDDMIEKPAPGEEFSDLAILGRVLLEPDIFPILETLAPGASGEIQLTDAMAEIARRRGMTALDFEGRRFDLGSKLGFLTANVVQGLAHPETGEAFRLFLRSLADEL